MTLNAIQQMRGAILERLSDAKLTLHVPGDDRAPWWLDARLEDPRSRREHYVTVKWEPGVGFGLSTADGEGYENTLDEHYADVDHATARVVELLRTGESTAKKDE